MAMMISGGSGSSRRRRRSSSAGAISEINVTPLVDVMLVLLIIFMVAAPLLTAGVQVDLPNSKAKPVENPDSKPIEISVNKEGKIFIGETETNNDNLVGLLTGMLEGNEEARIYIRADRELPYGEVSKLIGLVSAAGFTKVALVSQPEQ
ncbi:MAG: protein TolR [Alphaproteobacteria bacterium]|jgi:biopolymer transport protein TolR|nr:protein TolR [Alphaproteobacteria bacterium]MBK9584925.1 protein TolR [Alphaproteobacteria bacterium]MBP7757639.1 protein TolR [Alphaproteobacteria bacterium]MBP7761161.1 protein TolR [Alphaproteobacteria bacterium]MBP7905156.1 protein TolR [Alphaproteobacteria bacterium]